MGPARVVGAVCPVHCQQGVVYSDAWAHLFECDAQINVNDLACLVVDKDVGRVSIAKAQDMSHDGVGSNTARIVETHRKPGHRRFVLLGKVMPHDRFEAFLYTLEPVNDRLGFFAPLPKELIVASHNLFMNIVLGPVLGAIPEKISKLFLTGLTEGARIPEMRRL